MERIDLSSPEAVTKITKRIRISFQKLSGGIGNPEDAAQEILCRMLEGRHQHSTIDQAVIDYLRANYGDPRLPSYRERQNLERADSFESGDVDRIPRFSHGRESPDGLDIIELTRGLGGQIDRACAILHYKWGLSEVEIGDLFGFSESRVSQRLKRIQSGVSGRIKAQEGPRVSLQTSGQVAIVLRPETERQLWGVGEITFERMETGQSFGVESFNEKSF